MVEARLHNTPAVLCYTTDFEGQQCKGTESKLTRKQSDSHQKIAVFWKTACAPSNTPPPPNQPTTCCCCRKISVTFDSRLVLQPPPPLLMVKQFSPSKGNLCLCCVKQSICCPGNNNKKRSCFVLIQYLVVDRCHCCILIHLYKPSAVREDPQCVH